MWRRVARNRPTLLGLVLLSVLAVAASSLRQESQVRVVGTVEDNWRGAYDLLVRPPGGRVPVEETDGLVEPNFLAFSGEGGISDTDLAALRALEGVEVAAPVAVVGVLTQQVPSPVVFIPDEAMPSEPTRYRLTLTATTSDGIHDRLVQREQADIVLTDADLRDYRTVPALTEGTPLSWSEQGIDMGMAALPGLGSNLVAVDADAEARLVEGASVFAPLGELDEEARDVERFNPERIPELFRSERLALRNHRDKVREGEELPRTLIPLVVAAEPIAPLRFTLEVEQIGATLRSTPTSITEVDFGGPRQDVGTSVVDATSRMRPLTAPELTVPWPGLPGREGMQYLIGPAASFDPALAGRPAYRPHREDADEIRFRVRPHGPVLPNGLPMARAEGSANEGDLARGIEQSYRPRQVVDLALDPSASGPPYIFAPLATFDPSGILGSRNPLHHAPLGVYDAAPAELGVGSASNRSVELHPTLNPFGFLTPTPFAVTDLESARALRGPDYIDAIRVRVGGVRSFAQGRERIEEVATAVRGLGLEVDVVAGSSLQPVSTYVPDYFLPDGGDLGWVRQEWTTLGAATQVVRALNTANSSLLFLSVGAALVFMVGTLGTAVVVRLRDSAQLTVLGWSRPAIVRWQWSEMLLVGGCVLGAAALAYGLTGGGPGVTVGAAMGAAIPALSLPVIWHGARGYGRVRRLLVGEADPRWARRAVGTVSGPVTLAVRSLAARPARSALAVLSVATGGVAVGVGLLVVQVGRERSGATNLASFITRAVTLPQIAIVAAAVAGAIAVTRILARMDRVDRASERRLLTVAGWGGRQRRRHERARWAALSVLATTVAVAVVMFATRGFGESAVWSSIAAGTFTIFTPVWARTTERSTHAP